jgi:transglutaminase/protease-like cytokinesis protein 3
VRFSFLITLFSVLCLAAQAQSAYFRDVDFHAADSVAKKYENYSLKDTEQLAMLLTKDLPTDVEKFRSIFKWIAENISYDISSYKKSIRAEAKFRHKKKKLSAWTAKFNNTLRRRLPRKKTAICQGYATLLASLSNHAGLSCTVISGYGRNTNAAIGHGSINHAWNAVKLEGRWFLCDVTWASGSVDLLEEKFFREYKNAYFLTDPEILIANHYPADTSWTLLKNNPTKKDFLDAPIKPYAFLSNKINQYYPQKGILKVKSDSVVRFSFTANISRKIERAHVVLLRGDKQENDFYYDLQIDNEGKYFFDHRFIKKGYASLKIYVNQEAILYYKVYIQ